MYTKHYWSVVCTKHYWSVVYTKHYWSVVFTKHYWSLVYTKHYWSVVCTKHYWSVVYTKHYWSVVCTKHYWSVVCTKHYWSGVCTKQGPHSHNQTSRGLAQNCLVEGNHHEYPSSKVVWCLYSYWWGSQGENGRVWGSDVPLFSCLLPVHYFWECFTQTFHR